MKPRDPLPPIVLSPDFQDTPPSNGQTQRTYSLGKDHYWGMRTTGGSGGDVTDYQMWAQHPVADDSKHVEWVAQNGAWTANANQVYTPADFPQATKTDDGADMS